MKNAKLILDGEEYELPVVVGSEDEVGINILSLRAASGALLQEVLISDRHRFFLL